MGTVTLETKGFYYGWVVLAACFFVTAVTFGSAFSFGVFLTPFRESFGWTSAAVSIAYSVSLFLYTGLSALAGWSVDRYGPRVTSTLGGLFLGAGLLLTSQVSALWQLYATYGLIGIGMSAAYAPLMTTASRWFTRRRGLALGIVSAGIGTGPLIMAPFASYFVSEYGWRFAFYVMGGAAVLIIPAALLLRRSPPGVAGLPNGEVRSTGIAQSRTNVSDGLSESSDFSLREALGTQSFLLLASMFLTVGIGLQIVMAHTVAYSEVRGMSPMMAAGVLSTLTGASIAGRIISGIVSDRFGGKKTFAACTLVEGSMLLWLMIASNAWMLLAFAVVFGIAYGGHTTQFPALTGDIFGVSRMGAILGAVVFFWGVGGALGAILAGHIFDSTGSYSLAFAIGAVAMFIAAAAGVSLKTPKKKERLNRLGIA
jgi:MFS family permease